MTNTSQAPKQEKLTENWSKNFDQLAISLTEEWHLNYKDMMFESGSGHSPQK